MLVRTGNKMRSTFIKFKKWIRKKQFCYRDKLINVEYRRRLKNKDITIICSDCTGGALYKDLQLPFCSPTINLFFSASDFIKFINNLEYYLSLEMIEDEVQNQPWPIAKLGDLRLQLVHYESVDEAKEKWEKRKKRINWDNMFFIMNDRNGCTEDEIRQFDQFKYKNKVCFTHKEWNQYSSTFHLRKCDAGGMVKPVMNYVFPLGIVRHYDSFDYVSWFNNQ